MVTSINIHYIRHNEHSFLLCKRQAHHLLINLEETAMSAYSATCDGAPEQPTAKPALIRGLLASLLHEIRIRRALREVSALDDAALHDIGISPGGIEDAIRCGRR